MLMVCRSLNCNHLTVVPKELGRLTNMSRISLHINRILSLPEELGCMTALESFAAFKNEISEISGRMLAGWQGLTRLCLWTNQLVSIPADIGHMHNLQVRGLSFVDGLEIHDVSVGSYPVFP